MSTQEIRELQPMFAEPAAMAASSATTTTTATASTFPAEIEPVRGRAARTSHPLSFLHENVRAILFSLWAFGSGLLLLRFICSIRAAEKIVTKTMPLEEPHWESIVRRLGIRGPVMLRKSEVGVVPFTFGVRKPVVVLPESAARWTAGERRAVLTHELGHVARKDVFWQLLAEFCCAVYWFHPLVWLTTWRLRIERELACDDLVVLAGEEPPVYASILLRLASGLKNTASRRHVLGCTVAMARHHEVKRRIAAILNPKLLRKPPGRFGSLVLLLVAASGIVFAATLSPTEKPVQTPAESGRSTAADRPVADNTPSKAELISISRRETKDSPLPRAVLPRAVLPKAVVDERVELLAIVFRLAGVREWQCKSFTKYNEAIETHFADFRDHEAVREAKRLNQTPSPFITMGYDRVPAFAAQLAIEDGHVVLSDRAALRFMRTSAIPPSVSKPFAKILDDFYRESRFHAFFEANEELYRFAEKRFAEHCERADFGWYDEFFGMKDQTGYQDDFQIILIMADEHGGYSFRVKYPDGRDVGYALLGVGGVDERGMPDYNDGYIRILMFQYVYSRFSEKLVEKHYSALRPDAERLFPLVRDRIVRGTGTLQTPEKMLAYYLTYAGIAEYLKHHGNGSEDVAKYIESRKHIGFLWFDRLVESLDRYIQERDKYPTLDDFMPEIAALQDSIVTREYVRELRRISKPNAADRPKITAINPPDGAQDVDPAITEISVTFDRPMSDGYSWCTEDENRTFPKQREDGKTSPSWSEDWRTCTLGDIVLEPGKTYNIWFNFEGHDSFRSADGVPLEPVRYTFTTANKVESGGDSGADSGEKTTPENSMSENSMSETGTQSVKTAREGDALTLQLSGPDGKPVANAVVRIGDIRFEKDEILAGTFDEKEDCYRTDTEGRLVFKSKPCREWFFYHVTTPGYALYYAPWVKPDEVPRDFKVRLHAGKAVGGVVVDENGKPIAGATLNLIVPAERRPGDLVNATPRTTVTTDTDGVWRCEYLPESLETLEMQVGHDDFQGSGWTYVPVRNCLITPGTVPTFKQTLKRGMTINGKIVDPDGKPIDGATVRTPGLLWKMRTVQTGADGVYRLGGFSLGTDYLLVRAKGYAPEIKTLSIDSTDFGEKNPVDLTLQKGKTLRLRFVDPDNKPVEGATVQLMEWRGLNWFGLSQLEVHHILNPIRSDAEGRWVWTEAPAEELNVKILGSENAMALDGLKLTPSDEERIIILQKPTTITFHVVDTRTKHPIRRFKITPGDVDAAFLNDPKYVSYASWAHHASREVEVTNDEENEYRYTWAEPIPERRPMLLKIEADGYKPGISRPIKSGDTNIRLDIALEPGVKLEGNVLLPESKPGEADRPANGAEVTLALPGASLNLSNGRITGYNDFTQRKTNAEGRYSFAGPDGDFCIFVTHKDGFAKCRSDEFDPKKPIRLEAWSHLEGILRLGDKPASAGQMVSFSGDVTEEEKTWANGRGPQLSTSLLRGTADEQGRFVIGPVPPGPGKVFREIRCKFGNQGGVVGRQSGNTAVVLEPGKTTTVSLGGTGRTLIGKVEKPADMTDNVDWAYCMVMLTKPDGIDYPSLYACPVGQDGTFRLDDVANGKYTLTVQLWSSTSDDGEIAATAIREIDVPTGDAKNPLDLGTVRLEQTGQYMGNAVKTDVRSSLPAALTRF